MLFNKATLAIIGSMALTALASPDPVDARSISNEGQSDALHAVARAIEARADALDGLERRLFGKSKTTKTSATGAGKHETTAGKTTTDDKAAHAESAADPKSKTTAGKTTTDDKAAHVDSAADSKTKTSADTPASSSTESEPAEKEPGFFAQTKADTKVGVSNAVSGTFTDLTSQGLNTAAENVQNGNIPDQLKDAKNKVKSWVNKRSLEDEGKPLPTTLLMVLRSEPTATVVPQF